MLILLAETAITLLGLGAVGLVVLRWRSLFRGRHLLALGLGTLMVGGVLADTTLAPSSIVVRIVPALAFPALVGLSLLASRAGTDRPRPAATPVAWALVLWTWLLAVDLLSNQVGDATMLGRAASGLTLLAAAGVVALGGLTRRQVAALALLMVGLLAALTPFSGQVWRSCDQFGCSLLGQLFTGPFSSENYLSMQCAFLLAFGLGALPRAMAAVAVALSATILLSTGSSTSSATVVLVLVLLLLQHLVRRSAAGGARAGHGSPVPAVLVAACLVGAGTSLVLTSGTGAFSNRGTIWRKALLHLEGRPWTGAGLSRWSDAQSVGELGARFTHSLYLYTYFAGGVVALVLLVLVLAAALRSHRSVPGGSLLGATPVLALAAIGMLESVWNPLTVDGTSWPAIAVLCSGAVLASRRAADHAPPRGARPRARAGLVEAVPRERVLARAGTRG